MNTVSHICWAVLVQVMTGLELEHVQDPKYIVLPYEKIIPDPWYGLKSLPYKKNGRDCDKRSKIGYVEIYKGLRREIDKTGLFIPMTFVLGRVTGYGLHEFLLIGGAGEDGALVGRYYHRLEDGFEEIVKPEIMEFRRIW